MELKASFRRRIQRPSTPRAGEFRMLEMMRCKALRLTGRRANEQAPTLGRRVGSDGGGPCASSSAATFGPTLTKNSLTSSAEEVGITSALDRLPPTRSRAALQQPALPCSETRAPIYRRLSARKAARARRFAERYCSDQCPRIQSAYARCSMRIWVGTLRYRWCGRVS